VQVGAVKIYVAAIKVLRIKRKTGEAQETEFQPPFEC